MNMTCDMGSGKWTLKVDTVALSGTLTFTEPNQRNPITNEERKVSVRIQTEKDGTLTNDLWVNDTVTFTERLYTEANLTVGNISEGPCTSVNVLHSSIKIPYDIPSEDAHHLAIYISLKTSPA
jgi:hypothetical protein